MIQEFQNYSQNNEDASTNMQEESIESSKKYTKNKCRKSNYKQNLSQNF